MRTKSIAAAALILCLSFVVLITNGCVEARSSEQAQISATEIKLRHAYEAQYFKMSVLEYKTFKKDIQTELPTWKRHFKKYSKKYNVPWTLIAAVAYQESRWNEDAKSHTGVKGFMQITEKTADYIGIEDREDPIESIQGGAYYLRYLFDKTPTNLSNVDRWIQALAAYNVGVAHVSDIHRLAKIKKVDAYQWKNLKRLLPELTKHKNKKLLRYGLARGHETVAFIENVIGFNAILNFHFTQQLPTSRDFLADLRRNPNDQLSGRP